MKKLKFVITSGEPNITTMQQLNAYCLKKHKAAVFHAGRLSGFVDFDYETDTRRTEWKE